MPIHFSPLAAARNSGSGAFSVKAVDLDALCAKGSPIAVLDDFRVRGRPFAPHPHAGFSAVTYVFEDLKSGLRSRDSLGNDVIVGPGGIVWTETGSGVMHEEQPANPDGELHGLQIFVNLSAKNKLTSPPPPDASARDGGRRRVARRGRRPCARRRRRLRGRLLAARPR